MCLKKYIREKMILIQDSWESEITSLRYTVPSFYYTTTAPLIPH